MRALAVDVEIQLREETRKVVNAFIIGAVRRARSAIIFVYFSMSRAPRPVLS